MLQVQEKVMLLVRVTSSTVSVKLTVLLLMKSVSVRSFVRFHLS